MLVLIAEILDTTCEMILLGGNEINKQRIYLSTENIVKFVNNIIDCKNLLGRDFFLYRSIIEGLNKKFNINFEAILNDNIEDAYSIIILEAIIGENFYVEINEVEKIISNNSKINNIKRYLSRI